MKRRRLITIPGLTNPSMSSGGMSLGETLLASAAGAMIGAYIEINF